MEKLNFISSLLDKWTNLPDKKRITYITGVIIIVLCIVIYSGYIHYEDKITKLENDKITLKNECTISLNSTIARYESSLTIEREKSQNALEAHIKYVEKNEEEVRDILFYTKKYKKVKQ